jgi:plastocyanin
MHLRPAVVAACVLAIGLVLARPAIADSASVTIQNFAFNPSPLTVPVGSTVTWTNGDSTAHTTTSDNGTWDSGALSQGASFSFTFSQAGTYTYHCAIHPYMSGTIIVGGGGPSATSTPVPTSTAIPTAVSTSVPAPSATAAPTTAPTQTAVPTLAPAPTSTPRKHASKTISAKPKGQTFVFSPGKTTVKVGTRVTWVNHSKALHTVTSKVRGWKFNKTLNKTALSFTFKKAGTYLYHCTFHPGMVGKIVVKK